MARHGAVRSRTRSGNRPCARRPARSARSPPAGRAGTVRSGPTPVRRGGTLLCRNAATTVNQSQSSGHSVTVTRAVSLSHPAVTQTSAGEQPPLVPRQCALCVGVGHRSSVGPSPVSRLPSSSSVVGVAPSASQPGGTGKDGAGAGGGERSQFRRGAHPFRRSQLSGGGGTARRGASVAIGRREGRTRTASERCFVPCCAVLWRAAAWRAVVLSGVSADGWC